LGLEPSTGFYAHNSGFSPDLSRLFRIALKLGPSVSYVSAEEEKVE
jgi:hypothetical protein